ncbi:UvrD-helicase domain-containing protein, partial [Haloparvum sedimenti]|uniref:UvrD-helicase domain-containing protein n=1 Tax=Haloparvum sedimenti TaxID=1678448 RepID=UPI001C400D13
MPDRSLPELDETQRAVVEAFRDADAGLFTMDSHPGAGKSTATGKAAALCLYERLLAGDPVPERRLLVTSFSREDAADIVPDVVDWLWELYDRDEIPGDGDVTAADVRQLERRLRGVATVGTVDSVLRSVLEAFATEVGFAEMPAVGNEALLARLHEDCYATLASAPDHADRIEGLEAAYPEGGAHVDGLRTLLRNALRTCRQRRLSMGAFHRELRATVADVYDGGDAGTVECLREGIARCRGRETAERVGGLDADDRAALLTADRRLHDAWRAAVDDFCTLLTAYRDRYDELTRERGVIAHVDCAHLVAAYFGGEIGGEADRTGTEHDGPTSDEGDARTARRERLRNRFHEEIGSVIVDEAQDVSTVQHAALSALVTDEMRVLLVGDLKQCVYVWRDARPALFERAVREGKYFGIDWPDPVTGTATRNYRSRPGLVHAINAVATSTLPDPMRGDAGTLEVSYPPLEATRPPTERAPVHVATVPNGGTPGSAGWVAGTGRAPGAADAVANLLAGGVADGCFVDGAAGGDGGDERGENDLPSVTALFRSKANMEPYREALEARGFTVGNARVPLFATESVRATVAVLRWLADPTDPERTRRLVTESPLADGTYGLDAVAATFRSHDWSLPAVAETEADRFAAGRRRVVRALANLAADEARLRSRPATAVLRETVEAVGFETDPQGIDPDPSRRQRLANLDALVAAVEEWEGEDAYGLAELAELLDPFLVDPSLGPDRPLVDDDVDVVLKTIHGMKGDQDEVVVLADPVGSVGGRPSDADRLVTDGEGVGLAPPVNALEEEGPAPVGDEEGAADAEDGGDESSSLPPVPGFDGGLYDPDPERTDRDAGLRWTVELHAPIGGDATELVGHEPLRAAAAERRAESWRLLFVALTRAQEHLVLPLPKADYEGSPNSWVAALHEAMEMGRGAPRTTHSASFTYPDGRVGEFSVAVNDVRMVDRVRTTRSDRVPPATPPLSPEYPPWIPRFVRPSTFYPLKENPVEHVVDHLMGRALHTDTDEVSPSLDLPFDAVGPDAVGRIAHAAVAAVAEDAL